MALKAGRVGVAKSEVDDFGHITGGSVPENVYTKTQCDNKFETKTHASNTYETKENIGGLKFRDNDGTAQYQLPNGEWTNFSSGGGGTLGFNIPEDIIIKTGMSFNYCDYVDGGYYADNDYLYVDVTVRATTAGHTGNAIIIPVATSKTGDVCCITDDTNPYIFTDFETQLQSSATWIGNQGQYFNVGSVYRLFGQFVK